MFNFCLLQLQVTTIIEHYFNFHQQYDIFSMIIQNRTINGRFGMHTRENTQNLNITNTIEVTIISRAREPALPPNQNTTNDKTATKKPCFFIFSSFSIFACNSTCVQQ